MSKAAFKRTLRRRAGSDRPERKPLPAPAPPPRREYPEPTEEQLARFAAVLTFGPGHSARDLAIAAQAIKFPWARAVWLRRHREMQDYAASLETDLQTEPSTDGGR